MHWNTKRTARVICRRSIVVALAAIVAAGSTAGSLLAAGPLKPKSRVAIAAPQQPAPNAAASLRSPPPIDYPAPQCPRWFPQPSDGGRWSDFWNEILKKLLADREINQNGDGCLSAKEVQRLWECFGSNGLPPAMLLEFFKGLRRGQIPTDDQLDKILKEIFLQFDANKDGVLSLEEFKALLQSLGLMCPTIPSSGGSGGGVMLPELPC